MRSSPPRLATPKLTCPADVSLVIHAGGKSTRMGTDKALKLFLGRPLIQWVVERLAPIADEIMVTTNQPEKYGFLGLRILPDLVPGCGSLGGLYTGLAAASHPIVAMAACDMPFASLRLFEMAVNILIEEEVDIVVPRGNSGLEPMHAVYRRETCLPVVRSAIDARQLKVINWFPKVQVHEMGESEIAAADPSGLGFWNINTPEDFTTAEQRAQQ